jgi:hypothetical protein
MKLDTENNKSQLSNSSHQNSKHHETERSIFREKENTSFTSVIIKRNDQSGRHPDDILELATLAGVEQHERPWFSLFLSSLAAGWLVLASPSTVGQILCKYIITFIIGYGGLPHSIAGASEIFSGLLHSSKPDFSGSVIFIISAAFGSLFGGTLFVGVLNYAHIKKMQ